MAKAYTKITKVMTRDEHDKHIAQFDYLIRSCDERLKEPILEYAPRVKPLIKRMRNKLIKRKEKIPKVGERWEMRYMEDWDLSLRMNSKSGNHWYFKYNIGTGSTSLKRWQTKTCACEYCTMHSIVYPNDWKWSKPPISVFTYIGKPRLIKIVGNRMEGFEPKDGYAVFHNINFECIIRHYLARCLDDNNPLPIIKRGKVYLHNGLEVSSPFWKKHR